MGALTDFKTRVGFVSFRCTFRYSEDLTNGQKVKKGGIVTRVEFFCTTLCTNVLCHVDRWLVHLSKLLN
jgi:hypothetical protein